MTWRRLPHISSIVHYVRSQKEMKNEKKIFEWTTQNDWPIEHVRARAPARIDSSSAKRSSPIALRTSKHSCKSDKTKLHKQIDWFLTSGVRDKHTRSTIFQMHFRAPIALQLFAASRFWSLRVHV